MTDYRLYDSIYTERYMGLPKDNKEGYDAGSAVVHAQESKRPTHALLRHGGQQRPPVELAATDSRASAGGEEFRGPGWPDRGHSGISQPRMMEFFIENLVLNKPVGSKAGSISEPCRTRTATSDFLHRHVGDRSADGDGRRRGR